MALTGGTCLGPQDKIRAQVRADHDVASGRTAGRHRDEFRLDGDNPRYPCPSSGSSGAA